MPAFSFGVQIAQSPQSSGIHVKKIFSQRRGGQGGENRCGGRKPISFRIRLPRTHGAHTNLSPLRRRAAARVSS